MRTSPTSPGRSTTWPTRLSELGRREAALGPAEEGAGLYRELAAAQPDALRPDLAGSLNNLATQLSELGRREAALASPRRWRDPPRAGGGAADAFRPDLARSLNNLAIA